MEIDNLHVYINRVHPDSNMLHFDVTIRVRSHLTGTKIYALKQVIDRNDFEDLFHILLTNAEDQIRNTILMENAEMALKYERKRKVKG